MTANTDTTQDHTGQALPAGLQGDLFFLRANQQDLKELVELEQLCFDDPWSADLMSESMESAWALAILCRTPDGQLAGAALGQCVAGEAELHSLAIRPEFRGHGWGLRLLNAFLDECRHARAEVCYLDVREGNQPALALYQKVGFTLDGRRRAYYSNGEDALLMSLVLDH